MQPLHHFCTTYHTLSLEKLILNSLCLLLTEEVSLFPIGKYFQPLQPKINSTLDKFKFLFEPLNRPYVTLWRNNFAFSLFLSGTIKFVLDNSPTPI